MPKSSHPAAVTEATNTKSLIDAHVHLGRWRFNKFCGVNADIETVVRELRSVGIGGVALTTSDEGDNGTLLASARVCPLDCWVFLWARPGDASPLAELVQQDPRTIRGIKIHPTLEQAAIEDPRWDSVLELADAAGLAVMVHTGRWQQMAGYAQALTRAQQWPNVQFILSHAGGDTPELCMGAADEVLRRRLDNVFFDTTGLREHWAVVRAIKRAGHQRYMMGSDFPLAHPAMYVAQYRAMDLPQPIIDDLLGGNARRLLGPPCRPAREIPAPSERLHAVEAETTVLVTGAGGPIGVNLTRSLRMASRPLRLVGTDANRLHRPLAITDLCLAVPLATGEGYPERLTQIIEQQQVDLVIPTHPTEVRAISLLRDRLPPRAATFLPPHETILAGQDKFRSWELFSEAGVPVPRSIKISTPEDLTRAFDELGSPPIWLRGSGVPGSGIGVASLPVTDLAVARAWVEHHQGWGQFMASEFLPGDNLTWLCVWHQGVLWGSQTRKRIEYVIPHVSPSGITGAPAVCHTVERPEVDIIGEATVRAVAGEQPHGIFFVDLKSDAAGEPRVTEINSGRFGTTMHFYTAAGFNFPELAVDLALGRMPDAPVRNPIPADTYWIRTLDCGPVLLPGSALEHYGK